MNSDYVSFYWNGKSCPNVACYACIDYSQGHDIVCVPNVRGFDEALFKSMFGILLDIGLMPKFFKIDKNKLIIPKRSDWEGSWTGYRDTIYVNLCFYRWCDSNKLLIKSILDNYNKDVTFYQSLHYGCFKHVRLAGHSFVVINSNVYGVNKLNLAYSIVLTKLKDILKNKPRFSYGLDNRLNQEANKLKVITVKNIEDVLSKEFAKYYAK